MLTRDNKVLSGVIEQIVQVGMEHAPLEACGLLMFKDGDCGVQTILNSSPTPENGSYMLQEHLFEAVEQFYGSQWVIDSPRELIHESLVIWHTHPHGRVGPSPIDLDMRKASPEWRMLVVSIPSGEWVEF